MTGTTTASSSMFPQLRKPSFKHAAPRKAPSRRTPSQNSIGSNASSRENSSSFGPMSPLHPDLAAAQAAVEELERTRAVRSTMEGAMGGGFDKGLDEAERNGVSSEDVDRSIERKVSLMDELSMDGGASSVAKDKDEDSGQETAALTPLSVAVGSVNDSAPPTPSLVPEAPVGGPEAPNVPRAVLEEDGEEEEDALKDISPEEMVVHTLVPELSDQQHKLLKTAVVPAVAAVVLGVLVLRLCAGPKSLGLAKTTPFFLRAAGSDECFTGNGFAPCTGKRGPAYFSLSAEHDYNKTAEGGPLKLAKNKCVVVGKDSKLQIGACNSAGALGWRFVGGKLTQGANATIAKEGDKAVVTGGKPFVKLELAVEDGNRTTSAFHLLA